MEMGQKEAEMQSKKKGEKFVKEVKKQLETLGWTCCVARPSFMRFSGKFFTLSNDFFTIFDLIGKKKDCATRWIQATSIAMKSVKVKKILESEFIKNMNSQDIVEIWCKVPRKEPRIFRLIGNQFEEA